MIIDNLIIVIRIYRFFDFFIKYDQALIFNYKIISEN